MYLGVRARTKANAYQLRQPLTPTFTYNKYKITKKNSDSNHVIMVVVHCGAANSPLWHTHTHFSLTSIQCWLVLHCEKAVLKWGKTKAACVCLPMQINCKSGRFHVNFAAGRHQPSASMSVPAACRCECKSTGHSVYSNTYTVKILTQLKVLIVKNLSALH